MKSKSFAKSRLGLNSYGGKAIKNLGYVSIHMTLRNVDLVSILIKETHSEDGCFISTFMEETPV